MTIKNQFSSKKKVLGYINKVFRKFVLNISNIISLMCPLLRESIIGINQKLIPEPINLDFADTSFGFKIFVNGRLNKLENDLYYQGSYNPLLLKIIKKVLNADDVVIDIGAGCGFYSLYAAKLLDKEGQVYSLENNVNIFDHLQKNVFINAASNIKTINSDNSETTIEWIQKNKSGKLKLLIINITNPIAFIKNCKNILQTDAPAIFINFEAITQYSQISEIFKYVMGKNMYSAYQIDNYNYRNIEKIDHAGNLLFCQNMLFLINNDISILKNEWPCHL